MSRTLELNCLVLGDERNHIFNIEIPATKTVSALKKAIKEEKSPLFDHVPADNLAIWKVSVPVDETFEENLRNLNLDDAQPLPPVKRLSGVFSNIPEEHLHVVVRPPPTSEHHELFVASYFDGFCSLPRAATTP